MTKLTKSERDHLTLLHTAARDPMSTARERATAQAQLADQLVWTGRTDPMNGDLPRLLADLDAAEAERDAAVAEHTQRAVDQQNATAHGASWWPEKAIELRARAEKAEAQRDRAESERDALKAKLADPRRVVIHETEVVATKEEIASLKARLADLSEADEELHTCRALVNATSENLSVDLERMVDDLAEANEKAALSEKDSHSWHELYKDTKAKLAALVDFNVAELGRTRKEVWPDCEFCRDSTHDHECAGPELNPRWVELNAAIAAARGGAS